MSNRAILPVNLESEFYERTANIDFKTKEAEGEQVKTLLKMLEECGERVRRKEFDRLIGSSGSLPESRFDRIVVEAFVYRFLDSKDKQSLRRLLSMRCPDYVESMPLEWVVARRWKCEGVSVLVVAYRDAGTNAASRILLECLGRAFPELKRQGASDSNFVNSCARWINTNRSSCSLNFKYPYLPSSPGLDLGGPEYSKSIGLFLMNH